MKKSTILSLLVLIFITISSYGQKSDSLVNKMTEKMKTELLLTDIQYPKVQKINQDFIKEMTSLKNSTEGKFSKYKIMNNANTQRNKSLESLLTKEQFKKFESMQKENRKKFKEFRENKTN